jgi:5-methyltetrahydrofolate corrinoid/iron sulfur protein methyltransferase
MALTVVADNLTASNPAVALALKKLDPKPLQELARRCEQAGAHLLDLNPGYLSPRYEDRMSFLVEAVQQVSKLKLILDSPSARVLARGLKACEETPILNACTLEEEKLRDILPLAAAHKTDLVLLLLDAHSFPAVSLEGKVTLALELRQHALDAGIEPERLIFDPVVPNLSWPDAWRQAGEVLRCVRLLASGLVFQEEAATMAGLSNLRSGLRRNYPATVDDTLLAMLAGAGLSYVLADVLQPGLMPVVRQIRQII